MSWIEKLQKRGKENSNVPGWIRFLLVAPPLALSAYWWHTFTGLYRWMVEVQINLFSGYYIMLAIVLTIVTALLPSIIILNIISRNFQEAPTDGKLTYTDKINYLSANNPGFFKFYIIGFFLGVGTLGFALYLFAMYGSISDTPVTMDVKKEKVVAQKTTEHISTVLAPYCEGYTEVEESDNSSKLTTYIPLYDENGEFTYVFMENVSYTEQGKFKCAYKLTTLTGILSPDNLPGLVRDSYIKAGYMKEGDAYSVLEYGGTPSSKKELVNIMLVLSAIGFAIFTFLHVKHKPFDDQHFAELEEKNKQVI